MKVLESNVVKEYFELTNNVEYFERYKDFELHKEDVLKVLIEEYKICIETKDIELSKHFEEVINFIFDCNID